jgi:uncharacterized protein YoxC
VGEDLSSIDSFSNSYKLLKGELVVIKNQYSELVSQFAELKKDWPPKKLSEVGCLKDDIKDERSQKMSMNVESETIVLNDELGVKYTLGKHNENTDVVKHRSEKVDDIDNKQGKEMMKSFIFPEYQLREAKELYEIKKGLTDEVNGLYATSNELKEEVKGLYVTTNEIRQEVKELKEEILKGINTKLGDFMEQFEKKFLKKDT